MSLFCEIGKNKANLIGMQFITKCFCTLLPSGFNISSVIILATSP